MKQLRRTLKRFWKELRENNFIGGLAVFIVSAFITWLAAYFTDINLWIAFLVGVVATILWLICAYLTFKGGWKLPRYPRLRRWTLPGLFIIPLLAAAWVGYNLWQQYRSPTKVITLVADFVGPKPEEYGVTDEVLRNLDQA